MFVIPYLDSTTLTGLFIFEPQVKEFPSSPPDALTKAQQQRWVKLLAGNLTISFAVFGLCSTLWRYADEETVR